MTCNGISKKFGVSLNTANSINWGRIIFQMVYHAHSYLTLVQRGTIRAGEPVDICKKSVQFDG